jgi:hypothetical protein
VPLPTVALNISSRLTGDEVDRPAYPVRAKAKSPDHSTAYDVSASSNAQIDRVEAFGERAVDGSFIFDTESSNYKYCSIGSSPTVT